VPLTLRGREFRPSFAGLLIAVAACTITVMLGNWQFRRAAEKQLTSMRHDEAMSRPALALAGALADGGDPATLIGRRLVLKGTFEPELTYFLDNRSRDGRPGYEVLTPVRLSGSELSILVLRGWLPAGVRRDMVPGPIRTPSGELELEGVALRALSHALQPPGVPPAGQVRQNLSIAEFARLSGRAMLPFALEQRTDTADGLDRNWPRMDSSADKNIAYAVQWYCFAMLSVILFIVLSFRRQVHDGD
jgi:surfeit locus 1 family protein